MEEKFLTKEEIKDLFSEQRFAILSTCNNGAPYANIIAFICSDDLKEIIFVTPRLTKKFSNLVANPQASILVDNRSNTDADFYNTIAITVLGKTDIIEKAIDKEKYSSKYISKYPHLKNFIYAPDSAIVKLKVERYIIVSNFQNISVLDIE
ncbi:MAG: pyridoxamine 5'-phosphate oxidase family protein [Thermodesulfovibrionales bacterium]|nr:pyridoxamine 5'-phosphate oxidase family protein [Thermodesulfovibrionales bacterium]